MRYGSGYLDSNVEIFLCVFISALCVPSPRVVQIDNFDMVYFYSFFTKSNVGIYKYLCLWLFCAPAINYFNKPGCLISPASGLLLSALKVRVFILLLYIRIKMICTLNLESSELQVLHLTHFLFIPYT